MALSNVKYFLIHLKAWSLYWAMRRSFSISFFKFKALSIVILSNSTSSDSLIVIDPIFRLYLKRFFFPSIINWTFPGFAFGELIWSNKEGSSYHVQDYAELRNSSAIGTQRIIICEITNAWLFNDKKNVINPLSASVALIFALIFAGQINFLVFIWGQH